MSVFGWSTVAVHRWDTQHSPCLCCLWLHLTALWLIGGHHKRLIVRATERHLRSRSKLSRRCYFLHFSPSVPPILLPLGIHSCSLELFMTWSWQRQRRSSKGWAGRGSFSRQPVALVLSPLHSPAQKALPAHCCGFFVLTGSQETLPHASETLRLC